VKYFDYEENREAEEKACSKRHNRGAFRPPVTEISKCENFDEFSYDKHYYTGTNEYYLWKRDSMESACKLGSGTYYDIKKSTE